MLKYLRIAVTALSLTACALLYVLGARSDTTTDDLLGRISDERAFTIQSSAGAIMLMVTTTNDGEWGIRSTAHGPAIKPYHESRWRAGAMRSPGWYVRVPHWFLAAAFALLGIAPWCSPRQFSLRTLLIAMTLVAVGLGLIVAL